MTFDLVIPLFKSNPNDFTNRLNNLKIMLSTIPSDIHIILIEQVKTGARDTFVSELRTTIRGMRNITTLVKKLDPPFMKSWLYNVAVKSLAVTDRIILGESDIFYPKDYFRNFMIYISENNLNWCLGWDTVLYKGKHQRGVQQMNPYTLQAFDGGFGCWGISIYVDKFLYRSIGGCNEYLVGAGCVDNELGVKLFSKSGTLNKFPETLVHLYHPRNYTLESWGPNKDKSVEKVNEFTRKLEEILKVLTEHYDDPLSISKPLCLLHPGLLEI